MRKLIITVVLFAFCLSALNGLITYEEKVTQKRKVYDKTLEFIKAHPKSLRLSKLYFNVAELSTELEAENPGLIASYYKKALANKNFEYRDAALYNYGFYSYIATKQKLDAKRRDWLTKEGMNYPLNIRYTKENFKSSLDSYLEIYKNKESKYHSEVLLRLGEINFQIEFDAVGTKVYDESIKYFDELASKSKEDELWVFGLFNRGWSYFNAGMYQKSITDFTSVLDFLNSAKKTDELKSYFEDGALRTIAENLIEFDGNEYDKSSQAASKAMEILLPNIDENYGKESILRAISLKKRYKAPMQAIDLYNVCISAYPNDIKCPSYIDSISYLIAKNTDKAELRFKNKSPKQLLFAEKERLVYNYNTNSQWYEINKDKDIKAEVNIIAKAFKDVEARYYNTNVNNNNDETFDRYLNIKNLYTDFLTKTGYAEENQQELMDKRLTELSLDRTVQSFNFKYYTNAVENISQYNQKYPNQPSFYIYEEQLYSAIENIYIAKKKSIADSSFTLNYNGKPITVAIFDSLFINASIRFENAVNNPSSKLTEAEKDKQIRHILTNRAASYYAAGKVDDAYVSYQNLLSYNLSDELKALCYGRMAEISYNKNNFEMAIKFYDEGIKYSSNKEKQKFKQNRLASMKAKADNLSSSSSFEESATEYIKLADEYKTSDKEQRLGYQNKAIEVYLQANQYQKAIDLYLLIAKETKSKNKIIAAYGSAWDIADKNNDVTQGINLRYELINKYPSSNTAFELEKEIIAKYAKQDKKKAADMLLDLHSRRKKINLGATKPYELYIEAMRLYEDLNDEEQLVNLYLKFEKLYPRHELSEGLLIKAAQYYEKTGQDAEFKNLSIYMYKKNPKLDFYKNIAKKNIMDMMKQVDDIWKQRDYYNPAPVKVKLDELRNKYKAMVKKYRANGLKDLSYDIVYDLFNSHYNAIKFWKKYENEIVKAKTNFLNKPAKKLIRVNRNTTWKNHLVGGNIAKGRHRFKKVLEEAQKASKKLVGVITKAAEKDYLNDIPIERRTYLFYICAKINEKAAEAIDTQLSYYLKYANELYAFKKNKEQFDSIVNNNFLPATKNYTNLALVTARDYYLYMVNNFFFSGVYFDKYTDAALTWLTMKQIPLENKWKTIVSDNSWKYNASPINDIKTDVNIVNLWENIETEKSALKGFSSAKQINLNNYAGKWFVNSFTSNNQIQQLSVRYLANTPIDMYYNGILQQNVVQGNKIKVNNKSLTEYIVTINANANVAKHTFAFKTVGSSPNSSLAIAVKAIYMLKEINTGSAVDTLKTNTATPDTLTTPKGN